MQLPVALTLFALAFSLTTAQTDDNTPRPDICDSIFPTHHAPHEEDCQKFYNCNPVGAGFVQSCPNGLIYNNATKLCDFAATCPTWIRDCQNAGNIGSRNYPTQCCNTYFTVDCSTNAYSLSYCPENQRFNRGTRQCETNSAVNLQCSDCADLGTNADRCIYTGFNRVDDCRFGYKNMDASVITRCSVGTKFDTTQCTCVYSGDLNSCSAATQDCVEGSRNRLTIGSDNTGTFTLFGSEAGSVKVVTAADSASVGNVAFAIPYFEGNQLAHWATGFAFRLQFTLTAQPATTQTLTIMTNAQDSSCTRSGAVVSLEATITANTFSNVRSIRFTFTFTSDAFTGTLTTSQTINYNSGSSYTVLVSGDDQALQGYVTPTSTGNRITMTPSSSSTSVDKPFTTPLGCALRFGPFAGTLSVFDTWRCAGPAVLLQ